MTLEPPPLQEALNLEQMAPGVVHRLRLALSHNALGREFAVPVLVYRAREPGPVVGVTSAIHGNELNGIPTIHRLFDSVGAVHSLTRGAVVAVPILNTPGYLRFQREFHDGRDLNRVMPGKPDGASAELYAHRILDRLVRHFDYLIDLHTASFGRVNTLYVRADMSNPTEAAMARAVRPQIIVNNDATDGTLRGAASRAGVPSITVEIGDPQRIQPGLIRATRLGVQEVIEHLGLLPDIDDPDPRETVECSRSFWMYTDAGGILQVFPALNAMVKQGEVVATLTDPWGRVVRSYPSPQAGIVVGKSTNPAAHAGARIVHLGVPR